MSRRREKERVSEKMGTYTPDPDRSFYDQLKDGYSAAQKIHEEGNRSKAVEMAKSVFDYGIGRLDTVDEDTYRVVVEVMQAIRDSIVIWIAEEDDDSLDVKGAVD